MKNNQYIRRVQYKKDFAGLVLIGVIVVLVAIGGYFIWFRKINETTQNQNLTTTSPEVKNPESRTSTLKTIIKNETADWKTYTNSKYGFELRYPSDWSLKELYNALWFENKNGKQVVQMMFWLRDIDNNTLENYIKLSAGKENSRSGEDVPKSINNIYFEKIINTEETLGYISQWQIIWNDKTSEIETRADFESASEQPIINQYGKFKNVLSLFALETNHNLNSIDLLKSIASTFKFTK